jgi:hypothetical protein
VTLVLGLLEVSADDAARDIRADAGDQQDVDLLVREGRKAVRHVNRRDVGMVDPTREVLRRVDSVEAEAGVRGGSDGYERRARERRLDVADGGAGERLLDVAVGEGELPGRRGVGALVDDGEGDVVPPRTRVDGRDREARFVAGSAHGHACGGGIAVRDPYGEHVLRTAPEGPFERPRQGQRVRVDNRRGERVVRSEQIERLGVTPDRPDGVSRPARRRADDPDVAGRDGADADRPSART